MLIKVFFWFDQMSIWQVFIYAGVMQKGVPDHTENFKVRREFALDDETQKEI